MTGRYLLAIDAGTGSCRAVLFTDAGEQVAACMREWAHHEPPDAPGGQDFDTEAGWNAIAACVRGALGEAGVGGKDVAAVAATSMREGVVIYDRAGREIWACPNVDSRSAAEAGDLIREGAAEKIYAEAGDWVSITTPARLRWLARHQPGILDAAGSLGMLSDWIVYRLSGVQVTEPSCGSSSGMFTLAQRGWSPSIPALCGLSPDVLPPVVDPGTVVGQVTAAAADQTGLRVGTPVVAGGADTRRRRVLLGCPAAALAGFAGAVHRGRLAGDRRHRRGRGVPREPGRQPRARRCRDGREHGGGHRGAVLPDRAGAPARRGALSRRWPAGAIRRVPRGPERGRGGRGGKSGAAAG